MREDALRIAGERFRTIPTQRHWLAAAALLLASLGSTGCAKDGGAAAKTAGAAPASNAEPEVLATIGSDKITMADVRPVIGDHLDQLELKR